MTKNTFIFNFDWADALAEQPDDIRLAVYDAIIIYAKTGEAPHLQPLAQLAFSFIKKQMDRNAQNYDAMIRARSEAGKKGMAARWHNKDNNVIDVITNITSDNKNNYIDIDIDNDIDIDIDIIEENKKENIKEKTKEETPSVEDGADGVPPPPPTRTQKKKEKEPFVIPDDASKRYKAFVDWMKEYIPHFFNSCEHIITQEEMEKLISKFDKETFFDVLRGIENRKDKRGTYTNMYFTALNWLKSEYARREKNNRQQAWW